MIKITIINPRSNALFIVMMDSHLIKCENLRARHHLSESCGLSSSSSRSRGNLMEELESTGL